MRNTMLFIIICIASVACSRHECKTNNSVFKHYDPETQEYKRELLQQLNKLDKEKNYFLEGYTEKDSIPRLYVKIEADGFCAIAIVDVWRKEGIINDIIRTQGNGYIGAELSGFEMIMMQNCTDTQFIYRDMTKIID